MGAIMNHVVVARYKEDISWLNHVNRAENLVTVYEKFDVPEDKYIRLTEDYGYRKHAINHVMLPNIGNEAHTYLHHIVHMYYYSKLNSHDVNSRIFFVQGHPFDHSPEALDYINGTKQISANYETMCNWVTTTDAVGMPHHAGLPVGRYYQEIFGKELQHELRFGAGAQFVVTHEAIMSRPLDFWKKLLRMSEDTSTAPFVFERLWHVFFGQE
jgi:hypothetical protein